MTDDPTHLAAHRDLVVIGASAGGVDALRTLVAGLPRELPAAVCVVLHIAPTGPSALAAILSRAGALRCRPAEDGEPLQHGEILVAPPDRHMVIEDGRVRLTARPRVNGHRPSVDTLFHSAAAARGPGVVGVVLSGTRDDGTAGLASIKARGGAALVQDPEEAQYGGMPASALAQVAVDAVAPTSVMSDALLALVTGGDLPPGVQGSAPPNGVSVHEEPLVGVCPDCGGVLTERQANGVPQWTCHIGHVFSQRGLAEAQGRAVEAALWTALRSLEDRGALMRRMAHQFQGSGQLRSAQLFQLQADQAQEQAEVVRGVLDDGGLAAQRRETDQDEPVEAGDSA